MRRLIGAAIWAGDRRGDMGARAMPGQAIGHRRKAQSERRASFRRAPGLHKRIGAHCAPLGQAFNSIATKALPIAFGIRCNPRSHRLIVMTETPSSYASDSCERRNAARLAFSVSPFIAVAFPIALLARRRLLLQSYQSICF